MTTMTKATLSILGLCVIGVALFFVSSSAPAQTPTSTTPSPLAVSSYQLVSETRLSRTLYQLTYRVVLTNSGPTVRGVIGTATTSASGVTLVDTTVSFPAVTTGGIVTSTDTLILLQDRTQAFSTDRLKWSLVAGSVEVVGTTSTLRFANIPNGSVLTSLQEGGGAELYSATNTAALDAGNVLTPPDITVTTVPNPNLVSLHSFIEAYSDGWYSTYQSRQNRIVAGRSAIFVDDSTSTLPHFPSRAVLISNGNVVVVITGESAISPSLSEFEAFLASFEIQ